MTRPLRIQYPGAIYHVTSRGNAKQLIYRDAQDQLKFLEILASVVEKYRWLCHAYCLMDNHYHLVVETLVGNLSRGMRQLNGVYTQNFNIRHESVGHLFQGRFKALLVERESYLLEVCRYVVLNPVRAGFVSSPEDWKWSSFRGTAGLSPASEFLTTDWILSCFGRQRKRAQTAFIEFVKADDGEEPLLRRARGQVFIGGETFAEGLENLLNEKGDLSEISRSEKYSTRPPIRDIFRGRSRDEGIHLAHVRYGYTLKEIGEQVGLHYSCVSRIVLRVSSGKKGRNKKNNNAKNKT
ncbi:MAG: transposase [bacterium]